MTYLSAQTLNIPLARKVLEHIEAHPEEHDQNHFAYRNVTAHSSACGTAACIAGTAVLMDPETQINWEPTGFLDVEVVAGGKTMDVDDRAQQILGLNPDEAEKLFYNFENDSARSVLAAMINEAEAVQQ